ncbi:DUF6221 family protein [Arthrobacter sp. zg-Y20]|uniref:DUF6221 family protein n=1 Tax=unclassified Arthrobacter TaxID=235627 RepID=UPI001D1458C2|nr:MULTISPECIES: DUF6221 family protein [unclassified Arthrobacter]MCC3277548.1 DUF6221 family protein [Arthrobacter sp. zg-Y20]MDK1317707.1 DUF6221 family protein [Arthrobacter sp. zg.Y20]WIB07034.1 DUF6221 family protein [Arthrobacter sp. zg-Y20]
MDLKTFLLARIAEDEAVARAAVRRDGRWHVDQGHPLDESVVQGDIHIYDEGGHTAEQALHIATHDPARVLAECAAKRAIVELHELGPDDRSAGKEQGCMICGEWDDYSGWGITGPCATLRALAAVHADHPDYQPEWAQEASQA